MYNTEWQELHNDNGSEDKDVFGRKTYDHAIYVNEHVDYQVLVEIINYMDGTSNYEIVEQTLNVLDDDSELIDSFDVILPAKYREEALEKAEDYNG